MVNCEELIRPGIKFEVLPHRSRNQPTFTELDTVVLTLDMMAANREFYDLSAPSYAAERAWKPKTERSIKANLLDRISTHFGGEEFKNSAKILIVGTGTGKDQSVLQSAGYQHCYGLDLSLPMLKEGQQRFKDHLTAADARFIPYADKVFDLIYCDAAAEHMDYGLLYSTLNEFRRVVKTKGHVLLGARQGSGNIVKVTDCIGGKSLTKYFSTYQETDLQVLFTMNRFKLIESWSAHGGTPVAKKAYPWINSIIEAEEKN